MRAWFRNKTWAVWILACAAVSIVASGCATSAPPRNRCVDSLVIRGSPQFSRQVELALDMLKKGSPEAYEIVTNQVGVIQQAKHSGMKAEKRPPVFELNDRSAFYSVTWCAGVIAHDSFHSKLYHDYKAARRCFVPATAWRGHLAEAACIEHQVRVLTQIGAPEREIRHCQTATPAFADVPYRQRNW